MRNAPPPVQEVEENGTENSQDFEGYTKKFIRQDWQLLDAIHLLRYSDREGVNAGTANWSEMGCLAGDSIVTVQVGSGVRRWTLREAYLGFNRLNVNKNKNWKSDKAYYTHAFVDGRIRHHKIEGISFTGVKATIKIVFADGRSVRLTPDHLMLKPDGDWVEAQNVAIGDYMIVRGKKGAKHNADKSTRQYIYLKEPYPGATFVNVGGYTYYKIKLSRYLTNAGSDEVVHHKDETKWNDVVSNLETMTLVEHSRLHARDQIASYDAPPMQVVAIEDGGETDVYDLSMESPYHNFVASGVVVHNCYKTSTGLWYIERKLDEQQELKNPAILIITSKGGKGTFLEAIPEILPDFVLLNINTQSISMYQNGFMLKLPPDKLKYVPEEFAFPCVCLAHYDIFSRSNFGQLETDEEEMPIKDENGKYVFKPPLQSDYMIARKWDMVWCDEFHRLKDRGSRWTVNIKKLQTRYGKHGSTGTGFINRPDEIWSLLNFLDKKKYGSYWAFRESFCEIEEYTDPASGKTIKKVIGCPPEKRDEFRALVRDIGVRRTLDEVMPHIKRPIFKPVEVELNVIQRKMYNEIKMELATLDANGVELYAANVLSLLQRLRQICVGTPEVISDVYDPVQDRRIQKIRLIEPSSKLDKVMEILEELQWDDEHKEPLVVFSNFKDPLELLKARLDKHNEAVAGTDWEYKYIHLDVGDSDVVRYKKWHDEFPKLEHRVFMSTLQLGGESINLTPARHVVFLDRSWSPKDNSQGIGRIRRPGQEGQPVVIHINAINTTDQYIEKVNNIKHGWFKYIFAADE